MDITAVIPTAVVLEDSTVAVAEVVVAGVS